MNFNHRLKGYENAAHLRCELWQIDWQQTKNAVNRVNLFRSNSSQELYSLLLLARHAKSRNAGFCLRSYLVAHTGI